MRLRPVVGSAVLILALIVGLRFLHAGWAEVAVALLGVLVLVGLAYLGYRRLFDEGEQGGRRGWWEP